MNSMGKIYALAGLFFLAVPAVAQPVSVYGPGPYSGFPITLGSTVVASGSTVLSLTGLSIPAGSSNTLAGSSLALGGASLSGNALAVIGTANISGAIGVGGINSAATITATGGSIGLNVSNANIFWRSGSTLLTSPATAYLQYGNVDTTTATGQTLGVQNVTGASNVAGANTTLNLCSAGTGTGVAGTTTFNGAPHGTSGSTTNPYAAWLTVNCDTLAVTFAGAVSSANTLTFTTVAKGIVLKQGANGLVGTFVANGTSAVAISNTNVAITDAIIISLNTAGGTVGVIPPATVSITAGTGFSIKAQALDTSTYNYAIIKNAP